MKGLVLAVILGIVGLALLLSIAVHGQTPAVRYELGIFRTRVSLVTPFTVTSIPLEIIKWGQPPCEDSPDNIPNPTKFCFDDPADPTKQGIFEAPAAVISLPIDTDYRPAVRAIDANGAMSPWGFAAHTFRRAPRGQPCANGQGVQFTGENDIDGKPVRITICVQH